VDLGVYIHFPWCRRRCPYCDFAIAVGEPDHAGWTQAILAELAARTPLFQRGRALRSIYFGGGTPSLWRAEEIARVRGEVERAFPRAGGSAGGSGEGEEDLEITVEANPNPHHLGPATLAGLRAAGVNRLSIGAQAFDDGELRFLGRDHDARAAADAVAAARAAGFDNVSLDLICALPGRSAADFRRSLERAVALQPDHLSVYQLTIEERTPFGAAARAGQLAAASDDDAADQFLLADDVLGAAGYEHYEVSAYARPGRRARHNSLYWTGAEYLGLGNGAHSFHRSDETRGVRWSSHRAVARYLAENPHAFAERIEQDAAAMQKDRLWLGMRTSDGVLRSLVGTAPGLPRLITGGLVVVDGDRLRPTRRGLLFADEIGAGLLE
jgi:putative oxygen-independent coproporphyrinogen III oxidase